MSWASSVRLSGDRAQCLVTQVSVCTGALHVIHTSPIPLLPAYLDELRQQCQVVVCHDVASYSGEAPCPVAQVVVWTGAVDGTGARGCAVGLRVEVTSQ